MGRLGLIDEYELVVHSRLAGREPTLCAGLSKPVDLALVSLNDEMWLTRGGWSPERTPGRRVAVNESAVVRP